MIEVRADLRQQAALDWLLERVEIIDEDGNEVDRSILETPEPEEAATEAVHDEEVEMDETEASAGTDTDGETAEATEEEGS
jgi:hypothetical protein